MTKKKFKTITLIFCIIMIALSVGCNKVEKPEEKKARSIRIICEDTVLPMVNDLARDYNLNNETAVTVESLEREGAFNKLYNSEVDLLIGYVQPDNKEIEAEMLAYDGMGIIVNSSNKIKNIQSEELKKIYVGNILKWEELKGESQPIVPVAYKSALSSVQKEFDLKIMAIPVKEQMGSSIKYVSSVEEMKNFVAQNKNAIGFIPGQWYNSESVFLTLSGVEITASNLKNQLYPLRFPIKLYYPKEKKDNLDELFQYLKSEDGKKIIRKFCIEAF